MAVSDTTLRQGLKNQGGGYYNHNPYFEMFSPNATKAPAGKLADAINVKFGSLDTCKEEINKLAVAQFGSGWAWLSTDKAGNLYVSNSLNQDNPISEGTGQIPLIALDVWEHAYYLKYKNLRPDYINAFWEILDWKKVEARYESIVGLSLYFFIFTNYIILYNLDCGCLCGNHSFLFYIKRG